MSDPTEPTDAGTICPTCGPTTTEAHPRRDGVTRCVNCKEWLTELTDAEWELRSALTALRLEVPTSIMDHLVRCADAALAARTAADERMANSEVVCTNCEAGDLGCTACGAHGTLANSHPEVTPAPDVEGRGTHYPTTPVQCSCGWRETDADAGTWTAHLSREGFYQAKVERNREMAAEFCTERDEARTEAERLRRVLALVAEISYWDRPYDTRVAAIRDAVQADSPTDPDRGPRCGECRVGTGVHEPRDPQCAHHGDTLTDGRGSE